MNITKLIVPAGLALGILAGALTPRAAVPPENSQPGKQALDKTARKPFPASKCLVSGEPLNSMGKPVVMEFEGQELQFCCKECVKSFEKDKASYMEKLAQAEARAKPYPLEKCIVSDDPFDHGKPFVFASQDQQVKLCCADCLHEFNKNPERFMKKLREAAEKKNQPPAGNASPKLK